MSSQDQHGAEESGYGAAQEGTGEGTPVQELPDNIGREPGGAQVEVGEPFEDDDEDVDELTDPDDDEDA